MEFPDLGEQCSLKECRQLDFLPIKCSSCKQIFCSNHFRFEAHHCPVASEEEQKSSTSQDPVCPLCNRPVLIKAGESADYKVSEHIDKNCASEEREKVFKNRCSVAGCKRRELMPLTCESCRLNHCLSHRHPSDHQCKGIPLNQRNRNDNVSARAAHHLSSGISKSLSSGSQLLNSFTQRSTTAYENIRSSVANTFNHSGSILQPRLSSRPVPSPAAAAAAAAASARAAGVQHPNSGASNGNFNSLQGNLSEEEALSIAIQESLEAANRTGGNNCSLQTATNGDQKCQVS